MNVSSITDFRWSFSRDQIFRECHRKYYLHYIVPRLPEKLLEPRLRSNVLFLRQLSNRFLLAGQVVHQTISLWIDRLRAHQMPSVARIAEEAWADFLARCKFSRQERYLYHPPSDPRYTVLFEHVYQQPFTDQMLAEHYRQIKRALRNLSLWPVFQRLPQREEYSILSKEQLIQAEIGGVPVWLKLDLALRRPGETSVVDWKLSALESHRDLLQLVLYGIFVRKMNESTGGMPRLINFYLPVGTVREVRLEPALEKTGLEYLQKSASQLRRFHEEVAEGRPLSRFPAQFKRGYCPFCKFKKICFPNGVGGKATVAQGNPDGSPDTNQRGGKDYRPESI